VSSVLDNTRPIMCQLRRVDAREPPLRPRRYRTAFVSTFTVVLVTVVQAIDELRKGGLRLDAENRPCRARCSHQCGDAYRGRSHDLR
jgi:hypothetical protein